ncbi:MAG: peptide ABC transporter substrate-binding protein [Opitutaceae bacterium]|nr:peptide ABC transporter substrate-binding protein [Opitutaceae bacterium]
MPKGVYILLAAATLLLAGCARKSRAAFANDGTTVAAGGATTPKILRYGNGAEPQDLDPQVVTGTVEHRLILTFLEGLVSEDPNLNTIPGVAEKWALSPDGLVYTFYLRPDAKWSNGEPVTAQDFVQSYQRMLTPVLAAEYSYMLFHVVGAKDYSQGKLTDFARTGFKALDHRTLQITLRQPAPFLLHAMNHPAWYPVYLPAIKQAGGLDRRSTAWTRPENFVGNGPYVLKAWLPTQKIVAVRSPTYWDRARVKIEEIDFYPVELADTEERMFRTGQLDITNEVPLTKVAVYRREMPGSLHIDPYSGVYFYRYNVKRKPFDDVRVRRALALSIDRESLVKNVTLADETPAYHLVPPNLLGYNSRHAFQADTPEAKRLLAEAGYPGGQGFPRVELLYNTLEKHKVIAEALQQMWRKNLGIDITLTNQEWKVYIDAQHSHNFQFQRSGWIADYLDPHVFLDLWETDNGNNDSNWGNPEYDRLLHRALAAKTTEERYEIYQQMEKIILEEMPVMPIFFYTHARLINPRVKGYRSTPLDNFPWKYADIVP